MSAPPSEPAFLLSFHALFFCLLRRSCGWAVSLLAGRSGASGRGLGAPYARHPVHWILSGTTQILCSLLRQRVFNASETTAVRQRHSGDDLPGLASVGATSKFAAVSDLSAPFFFFHFHSFDHATILNGHPSPRSVGTAWPSHTLATGPSGQDKG